MFWSRIFKRYKKTSEQGHEKELSNLGACYATWQDVPQDYKKAVECFKMAAKHGDARAQFCLGKCYQEGQGVPQDYKKAVKWLQKAAEQGFAEAQFNLGMHYEFGFDVPKNYDKAIEWLFMAAEQGDAHTQYHLGECCINGQGVPRDYNKAIEWFVKAAEQGHTEAQYVLGLCYSVGTEGISSDYKKAEKWFLMAAEHGDARAQYGLGVCYTIGSEDVPQNFKKAAEWLQKAADQGHSEAKKHLDEINKYVKEREKIAIWLNSIKHEFGCEILCENVREISKDEDSAEYIVNGRKYIGKESFQTLKIKSHDKVPEFESKDLCIYKDSYDDMVFAVIDYDVPTFDIYDRMYDGRHYLFFFHNKKKISAMYCAEGYNLGKIRIFENITPVNDSLVNQLKELEFPL